MPPREQHLAPGPVRVERCGYSLISPLCHFRCCELQRAPGVRIHLAIAKPAPIDLHW
jgi:hypothetical protein